MGSRLIAHTTPSALLVALSVGLLTNVSSADTECSDVTSENIVEHLSPAPGYPLVGFWKDHCEDAFGLAVDRAGKGLYSISFCGPGGCFPPGTFRPNSPIIGDPDYNVVDQDTLDVRGRDGFSTYFRCSPHADKPGA